jgi:hypothetical protein
VLGLLLFITPNLSFSVEPRLVGIYSYFENRATNAESEDTISVELKGENLLILSVHF